MLSSIDAGNQVTDSYGVQTNARFLSHYGFTVDGPHAGEEALYPLALGDLLLSSDDQWGSGGRRHGAAVEWGDGALASRPTMARTASASRARRSAVWRNRHVARRPRRAGRYGSSRSARMRAARLGRRSVDARQSDRVGPRQRPGRLRAARRARRGPGRVGRRAQPHDPDSGTTTRRSRPPGRERARRGAGLSEAAVQTKIAAFCDMVRARSGFHGSDPAKTPVAATKRRDLAERGARACRVEDAKVRGGCGIRAGRSTTRRRSRAGGLGGGRGRGAGRLAPRGGRRGGDAGGSEPAGAAFERLGADGSRAAAAARPPRSAGAAPGRLRRIGGSTPRWKRFWIRRRGSARAARLQSCDGALRARPCCRRQRSVEQAPPQSVPAADARADLPKARPRPARGAVRVGHVRRLWPQRGV